MYIERQNTTNRTKIAVRTLQIAVKQIAGETIGVFKHHDEWFPVLESEKGVITYMANTRLFGLSECHVNATEGLYLPFPDGKTLNDMTNDALGFHYWCKANQIY